jgi:aminoglycoside 6-adenylyltransferase
MGGIISSTEESLTSHGYSPRAVEVDMRHLSNYEQDIIEKLIRFGESQDAIRAIVLTSSLCNPNAPADILSDFDIELFFEDPTPFAENDDWIPAMGFGPVMALWHWPNEWDEEKPHGLGWTRMVYFQDGTKMDISLAYLSDLRKISSQDHLPDGYDIGYKILLDKDGVTASIKPPTFKAFILEPPSAAQYASRVEMFWMESTYVAKHLWRDDIVAAKDRLHTLERCGVREVLEWHIGMEHGWTWKPGSSGRGLGKALDPGLYREMLKSYSAGDIDGLWQSLSRTTALYSKMAIKIAEGLGFSYPYDLDERVSTYHRVLKDLDRETASREELASLLRKSGRQ